jgi:hypothetical protein
MPLLVIELAGRLIRNDAAPTHLRGFFGRHNRPEMLKKFSDFSDMTP